MDTSKENLKGTSVEAHVRALVKSSERAFLTDEIVSKVNASEAAVKRALHSLSLKEKIYKVRQGVYVGTEALKRMYE